MDALLLLPAETQGFHLISPVCALGTFPSRGRLDSSREAFDEEKQKDSRPVNCTPFVRQYAILSNKWGVNYAKRSTKQKVYARI